MKDTLLLQYDPTYRNERSTEALLIYRPAAVGYICHRLARTVCERTNADAWRLSLVTACDNDLQNHFPITCEGAEWEMALRLQDRPDFIGGFAHGDERDTAIAFFLDGHETDVRALTAPTPCRALRIAISSIGYDPLDSKTEAILHRKEYEINADGILLRQTVEWLGDYSLSSCYTAMMPPLKTYTDTYETDLTPATAFDLRVKKEKVTGARSATLFAQGGGFSYTMEIEPYGLYPEDEQFTLTDNGGAPYNKMYFSLCESGTVKRGMVWNTVTRYRITHKK